MDLEGRINDAGGLFGCSEVKTSQSDVKNVVKGRDVFLMAPTGSGKSITQQLIKWLLCKTRFG